MARQIVVGLGGGSSSFSFSKLERAKLYGRRRRVALDAGGEPCGRAQLTRDGRYVLRHGMTAQGYFTEKGTWLASAALVGLDADGEPLEKQPSTLGNEVPLEGPLPPEVLLDHRIGSVYMLDPTEADEGLSTALAEGGIFRFDFRYRDGFSTSTAFLLQNEEGTFALIGEEALPEWIEPAAAPPPVDDEDDAEGDDLDFEMF